MEEPGSFSNHYSLFAAGVLAPLKALAVFSNFSTQSQTTVPRKKIKGKKINVLNLCWTRWQLPIASLCWLQNCSPALPPSWTSHVKKYALPIPGPSLAWRRTLKVLATILPLSSPAVCYLLPSHSASFPGSLTQPVSDLDTLPFAKALDLPSLLDVQERCEVFCMQTIWVRRRLH